MLKLLMIEDDEADAVMLQRAFDREGINNTLQVVTDGSEGVRYLLGEGNYADREKFPFPHVIFLDLNMPVMTGFEVLEWRKTHAEFHLLPTTILSASNRVEDIRRAYQLGANAYFVKPSSLSELQKFARTTYDFWSSCSKPNILTA